MTIRDYFAGQALVGAFAAGAATCLVGAGISASRTAKALAKGSYVVADAMLAERKIGASE